jgi:exodeoxyribonuclease V alpha subunit
LRSLAAEPGVATEQVSGLVERVTYHNPENGFAVLRVKVRGRRELLTVVGHCATISAGEHVQASGSWVTDRTHGLQLKAVHLTATPPTGIEGIRRYLGSGMVRGIGPVYAEKLTAAFGEAVLDVIETEPARLQEVSGIGEKRAAAIVAAWAEQKAVREIMLFLHGHGVSTARAVRIFKTYGDAAVAKITEDPYRLARDIRGIGFRSADKIAASLGIEKTAMVRARAGVAFALAEAMDQGHCGLPEDELLPKAAELLEIPEAIVAEALGLELEEGRVVADTLDDRRCVFLAGLYRAERAIAARLTALSAGLLPWPAIDQERAIPWAEEAAGIQLAESQREALALALRSKVLVITGGPGVGKTTLVNTILRVFRVKGVEVALAAPTGRAAAGGDRA